MGYPMFLVAHNTELPRRKLKLINNPKGENNVTVIFLLIWFIPSLFGRILSRSSPDEALAKALIKMPQKVNIERASMKHLVLN